MDRAKTLARIRGPYPSERKDFEWVFIYDRKVSHSLKKMIGRRFYLRFYHDDRVFRVADARRRISKRNKREEVVVCKAVTAYLKTRLPPAEIARCLAAAITRNHAQRT